MRERQSSYTEEELLRYLVEDTTKEKLYSLYNEYYVGQKSISVKNTKIRQYDFIAKFLLSIDDNLEEFFNRNIPVIQRTPRDRDNGKTYKVVGHNPQNEKKEALTRQKPLDEEWLAKSLLLENFDHIGEIIDYQIPLNEKDADGAGNVDLLAYNKQTKRLSLIELKREDNQETMLRAILEISTYFCQIDRKTLKEDFSGYPSSNEEPQKVVLVFKDSKQHQQYNESQYIKELAKKLNVIVLLLDNKCIITP